MNVVWSRRALTQLDAITSFIARDNPAAAMSVARRIRVTASLLGPFPRIGRQTDEAGVYILPVPGSPYLLFYRLADVADEVRIIRVRHGARRKA